MSIPLDRLYHFLADVVNDDDVLIYRWWPHGSRKLEDLWPLRPPSIAKMSRHISSPIVICHDQEPLQYHRYSQQDLLDTWFKRYPEYIKQSMAAHDLSKDKQLRDYLKAINIKCACPPTVVPSVLLHSEKNSYQIQLYQQHGFVPCYYWSHALIARDWFRYAAHDPVVGRQSREYEFDFLIYNRAWSGTREYRLKFAEMVVSRDLARSCLTSFCEWDQGAHYSQHNFSNPCLQIYRDDLHTMLPSNHHPSSASADYNNADYAACGLEIVLETLFDDQRWHLTEKTLRPIACGKPFVLLATSGSLAYLRSYGFRTFDGIIDESYDLEPDPLARLQMAVREMKRIQMMPSDQKQDFFSACGDVTQHNRRRFFSDQFQQDIVNECAVNLETALQQCRSNRQVYWAEQYLDIQDRLIGKLRNPQSQKFADSVRRALF